MKKIYTITALLLVIVACATDPDDARKTLFKAGFSEPHIGGVSMTSCGQDDYWGREFTAKNPSGTVVSGVVCCASFKGCTVRF